MAVLHFKGRLNESPANIRLHWKKCHGQTPQLGSFKTHQQILDYTGKMADKTLQLRSFKTHQQILDYTGKCHRQTPQLRSFKTHQQILDYTETMPQTNTLAQKLQDSPVSIRLHLKILPQTNTVAQRILRTLKYQTKPKKLCIYKPLAFY